jgi:hypothetical protein
MKVVVRKCYVGHCEECECVRSMRSDGGRGRCKEIAGCRHRESLKDVKLYTSHVTRLLSHLQPLSIDATTVWENIVRLMIEMQ